MKKLFILRHAEAGPASKSDFERALTERGISQAKDLGEMMNEKGYAPALVLCSSALRTRLTLEGVMESVRIPKVEHTRDIYHAEALDLMDMLRAIDEKYSSVLLVGHNPAIHQLAAALAGDNNPAIAEQVVSGYPPATLTVLNVATPWAELKAAQNDLVDLIRA